MVYLPTENTFMIIEFIIGNPCTASILTDTGSIIARNNSCRLPNYIFKSPDIYKLELIFFFFILSITSLKWKAN